MKQHRRKQEWERRVPVVSEKSQIFIGKIAHFTSDFTIQILMI